MYKMAHKFCCLLFLALLAFTAAQYYTPYNPYNTPSPTFSSLNGYHYSTASPYYYNTPSNYYNDVRIRIWPYVIGQYLYPSYYNNNNYNPYATLNTPNWLAYYATAYRSNYGKK